MIALNNATLDTSYSDAQTRQQPETVRVNLTVQNGDCLLQLADERGDFFEDEQHLPPGGYSLNRLCGGARIRSVNSFLPALVTLVLLARNDVP